MITYGAIGTVLKDDPESINNLKQLLSPGSRILTLEEIYRILNQPNLTMFVARDREKMVGMVTCVIVSTLNFKRGYIHDLVVDQNYQRKGVGSGLIKKVLVFADSQELEHIDLTSKPSRRQANKLYLKFGFRFQGKIGETKNSRTNYYRRKYTPV